MLGKVGMGGEIRLVGAFVADIMAGRVGYMLLFGRGEGKESFASPAIDAQMFAQGMLSKRPFASKRSVASLAIDLVVVEQHPGDQKNPSTLGEPQELSTG